MSLVTLMLCALPGARASGVLFDGDALATLERLDVSVAVEGRVGSATGIYRFADPGEGDWVFAARLPDGAAAAGLRYRQADGDWIEATPGSASEAPDAEPLGPSLEQPLFVAALPALGGGPLEIALDWQQALAARGGALTVAAPLDDGGLNPGDPPARVTFEIRGLGSIESAELSPGGAVDWSGQTLSAEWSGTLDQADAAALSWSEAALPLGVELMVYRPAEDPFTGEVGGPGYALAVIRPGPLDDDDRVEKLFTFVLDVSASMAGEPLQVAGAAGARWLEGLRETDRFNVVPYASQPYPFARRAPRATSEAVAEAAEFLADQDALGLSDPEEALVSALTLSEDTLLQRTFFGCSGTRQAEPGGPPLEDQPVLNADGESEPVAPYVVLLTDGGATTGVTGVDDISASVASANTIGASLFAVGVGPGADRALLDRLAAEHRGAAAYADDLDQVEAVVASLEDRIRDPLLVRPAVDVEGAWDQAPAVLEDASAGYELLLAFRWDSPGVTTLTLDALRGRDDLLEQWPVLLPSLDERLPVVARAWAQLRVADLDAAYAAGDGGVYSEIADLVSDYGVASEHVTLSFGESGGDAADAEVSYASAGCDAAGLAPLHRSLLFHLSVGLAAALTRRRSWGSRR